MRTLDRLALYSVAVDPTTQFTGPQTAERSEAALFAAPVQLLVGRLLIFTIVPDITSLGRSQSAALRLKWTDDKHLRMRTRIAEEQRLAQTHHLSDEHTE